MGIKYRNNAGANAKSVAQLAITHMFMLLSRIPQHGYENTEPTGEILGEELDGKTVGIVGMGNIGKELADKFKKLNIPTVFYNRTGKNVGLPQVSIEEVFGNDIVFLTIATNEETKNMLSNISSLIKKHQYLIDISAYDDFYDKHKMISSLQENNLAGYAFETSNPQDYRTKEKLNLVITPHMAWSTLNAESNVSRHYLQRTLMVINNNLEDIDFVV
jgi:D-3-phosphoglycerate dehydrogenase